MRKRHPDVGAGDADIIVALGGDGFMLQTLHAFLGTGKPIYGMNLGSVGFLMNEYRPDKLIERLERGRTGRHPSLAHEGCRPPAAPPRRWPSMKSRCCAKPGRPPRSVSRWTSGCGSRN